MAIVLDVEVAPFLIVTSVIFSVLYSAAEHLFNRAENLYRATSVKKGLPWRGFLVQHDCGRLKEVLKSKRHIRPVWILISVFFSVAMLTSCLAGEAAVSTRIENRSRGTIVAHAQFGSPLKQNNAPCESPRTCEPLREYLKTMVRIGDFDQIDFHASSATTLRTNVTDEEKKEQLSGLPKVELEHDGPFSSATFQTCLRFFDGKIAKSAKHAAAEVVVAESCGSIEKKHSVKVSLVEPAVIVEDIQHSDGENASHPFWFSDLVGDSTAVRSLRLFSEPNTRPVHRMDLTYYMGRKLPAPCELYRAVDTVESQVWVFVCRLNQSDLYIGTVRETDAQTVKLRSFHLMPNATGLELNSEDVMDAIAIMGPGFASSDLGGRGGCIFALKSYVYGVMMSTNLSGLRTVKPVALVAVSTALLIFAAALLLIPLIIFVAASYANSLTLPAGARNTKLDLPTSAYEIHKAAVKQLNAFGQNIEWTDYDYALHPVNPLSTKLRLGWTTKPCDLGDSEISPV